MFDITLPLPEMIFVFVPRLANDPAIVVLANDVISKPQRFRVVSVVTCLTWIWYVWPGVSVAGATTGIV